jgi:2-iminobutanoate/2-iminopropanoate deaminase
VNILIRAKEKTMGKKIFTTNKAFVSKSPLSQAVQVGNIFFVSGQVPVDSQTMTLVSEDFVEEARHVLNSIKEIMESAGLTLKDITKTTVFLTDMSRFQDMNEIYRQYFPEEPPARTCIGVKELPRKAQIEIEAIAVLE